MKKELIKYKFEYIRKKIIWHNGELHMIYLIQIKKNWFNRWKTIFKTLNVTAYEQFILDNATYLTFNGHLLC